MRFTGSLWTTTFQGTSRDSSVLLSCSTSVPGMSGKTRLLSGRGSAGKRGRFRGRGRGRRREQRLELIDPARSIRMRGEGLDQGEHFRGGAMFVADGGEVLAAAPEELRPAHGVELMHFDGELRAGGAFRGAVPRGPGLSRSRLRPLLNRERRQDSRRPRREVHPLHKGAGGERAP